MTTTEFIELAAAILDEQLRMDPVGATSLGDHRFDDRLAAIGPEAPPLDRDALLGGLIVAVGKIRAREEIYEESA